MSCSELGFDDDGTLRVNKSADTEVTFPFPDSYDFTGYTGDFQVRATADASTALLTVTETATVNGSVLIFDGSVITVRLKVADLVTLPNASPASDDWLGVYQWVNTDPDGLVTQFAAGVITAQKGVVR